MFVYLLFTCNSLEYYEFIVALSYNISTSITILHRHRLLSSQHHVLPMSVVPTPSELPQKASSEHDLGHLNHSTLDLIDVYACEKSLTLRHDDCLSEYSQSINTSLASQSSPRHWLQVGIPLLYLMLQIWQVKNNILWIRNSCVCAKT